MRKIISIVVIAITLIFATGCGVSSDINKLEKLNADYNSIMEITPGTGLIKLTALSQNKEYLELSKEINILTKDIYEKLQIEQYLKEKCKIIDEVETIKCDDYIKTENPILEKQWLDKTQKVYNEYSYFANSIEEFRKETWVIEKWHNIVKPYKYNSFEDIFGHLTPTELLNIEEYTCGYENYDATNTKIQWWTDNMKTGGKKYKSMRDEKYKSIDTKFDVENIKRFLEICAYMPRMFTNNLPIYSSTEDN